MTPSTARPQITIGRDYVIYHNHVRTQVSMTRTLISIGCTDITPEAAEFIMGAYSQRFPKTSETYVLQEVAPEAKFYTPKEQKLQE